MQGDAIVPPHGPAGHAAAEAGGSPPRKQPRQGAAADSPLPLLCGAGPSNRHARENARVHAIMGPPVPAVGGPQESAHVCVHTHSPAGGAHPSASMLPPVAWPKLEAMGPPGGSAYACSPQHTDINIHIAHMREHEYPSFMSYHMSQGVPHPQAQSMYNDYERMRVNQRVHDMNTVPRAGDG